MPPFSSKLDVLRQCMPPNMDGTQARTLSSKMPQMPHTVSLMPKCKPRFRLEHQGSFLESEPQGAAPCTS